MKDNQKQRLERNLSRSAAGAKPYWPRVLLGPGVEDQGYINPSLLPISRDENLGAYILRKEAEAEKMKGVIKELEAQIETLQKTARDGADEIVNLGNRLAAIEGFTLD